MPPRGRSAELILPGLRPAFDPDKESIQELRTETGNGADRRRLLLGRARAPDEEEFNIGPSA